MVILAADAFEGTLNPNDLLQRHPLYQERVKRWQRWRDFGGGLDESQPKKRWLPKGSGEDEADYELRLELTHDTGLTSSAIKRLTGTLNKASAKLGTEDSLLPEAVIEALEAWRSDIDGAGRDLKSWWGDNLPELLRMGLIGVEVCRDEIDTTSEAGRLSRVRPPYLCTWTVEEIINWSHDDRGVLEWVVLHRTIWEQASPASPGAEVDVVRVLSRDHGWEFTIGAPEGIAGTRTVERGRTWEHSLGIVPLAEVFAHRNGPMDGGSYVDRITLNDLRKLQVESDQAEASHHAANPTPVIYTKDKLSEVMAGGATAVLKLRPGGEENFEWKGPDTSGLALREEMLARNGREALNSAGIDPAGAGHTEGVTARSGISMAWSFTAQEEPILNDMVESLESGERQIMEIRTRWELPKSATRSPYERKFDGTISRQRGWDLLATRELIELAAATWSLIPSIEFRKKLAIAIVGRLLPDLTPKDQQAIADEIAAADQFDLGAFNRGADDEEDDAKATEANSDDLDAEDADDDERDDRDEE